MATALAAISALAVAFLADDERPVGVALVMLMLTGWLLLTRRGGPTWDAPRYVGRAAVGLFLSMLLLLPLAPALAPTIAMACLVPLFAAVPYLGLTALRRFGLLAWVFSTSYVLAASVLLLWRGTATGDVTLLALEVIGTAIIVGFVVLFILRYADANEAIRFLTLHDPLTGLINRALLVDRLRHCLSQDGQSHRAVALVCLGLDGFKATIERHGHAYGDTVLRIVADRLRSGVRTTDAIARLGDDEFAVLIEDVDDRDDVVALAERLRWATLDPGASLGDRVSIDSSVGIAFSDDGGDTSVELLRNANYAMRQSKRTKRGGVVVYAPSMRPAAAERRAVRRALRGIVERQELRLQYQPIVRLHSGFGETPAIEPMAGSVVGMEALVRWQDPQRGRRMPDAFIALAEETGDIVAIGRWVFQEACQQLVAWQRLPGMGDLRVSVNLSARQLQRPGLVDDIEAVIATTGIARSSIELEITEHVLMRDSAAVHGLLRRLRSAGIHIALDDFGTGYSSFSYLRDFPVDTLKVDRSFVQDAVHSQRGAALLRAMVDVGAALHAKVVVEGIETTAQLDLVRSLGCDLGQGFVLSRPMDADAVSAMLAEGRRPWDHLLGASGTRPDIDPGDPRPTVREAADPVGLEVGVPLPAPDEHPANGNGEESLIDLQPRRRTAQLEHLLAGTEISAAS